MRNRNPSPGALVLGLVLLATLATGAARPARSDGPEYRVNPLGVFFPPTGFNAGFNAAGQVVALLDLPSGQFHAFRSAPHAPFTPADDLGTLGGSFSAGYGICPASPYSTRR